MTLKNIDPKLPLEEQQRILRDSLASVEKLANTPGTFMHALRESAAKYERMQLFASVAPRTLQ